MTSKIEWCDETINPQGWGCWGPGGTPQEPRRCWYCYIERQARGPYVPDCPECKALVPHWHVDRLMRPYRWRKPRRIFWQSMGDLFHHYTPTYQLYAVLSVVRATPQHIHIFCTKNPARYADFNPWPANCILLTTVTGEPVLEKPEEDRVRQLLRADCRVRGVSLEPLLGPVEFKKYQLQIYTEGQWLNVVECGRPPESQHLNWLIIGAYTGKAAAAFQPEASVVQSIIDQGRSAGVPIFLKDNLHWPEKIQEWP